MQGIDAKTGDLTDDAGNELAVSAFNPTRVGLEITGAPSFEQWCAYGQTLGEIEGAIQWWRGDWLNYGERAYGEKYAQAIEAFGREYQTLANYAYVTSRITLSRRRENLVFGIHAEVAPLEPVEQIRYLDLAAAEGLSIEKLRKRIAKDKRRRQAQEALAQLEADESERFRFFTGDFRDVLPGLEPSSVDAVITDPPYPQEYLGLYEALALEAKRLLRPGGSLLVMCGQSYLPQIVRQLSEHLTYYWTLSYQTPGGQAPQIWQRRVITFYKPVLWFVKGDYEGSWIGDVIESGGNDKRHHDWGQSEAGFAQLVERFTLPGQTVLDPFLGGGTTGVAAARLQRNFVGVDVDPAEVEISKARILEAARDVRS